MDWLARWQSWWNEGGRRGGRRSSSGRRSSAGHARGGGFQRRLGLEPLEARQMLTVSFTPLVTSLPAPIGKDVLVPLTAIDSTGAAITYQIISNSNADITPSIVTGGSSLRLNVSGVDSNGQPFSGDLIFRLFDDLAPDTIERITELVNNKFYNGLTFHRILNNFVAQGGDPSGTGSGGSGTQFDDEFNTSMTFNSPGLLAMAKGGDDTNDSQFFIVDTDLTTLNAYPQHLNFNHTIFGQLVSGFDTYSRLIGTTVANAGGTPVVAPKINSANIITDTQNGVMRLSVAGNASTGSATITVRALSTGDGSSASQTFTVNLQSDIALDPPFLNAFPAPFQGDVISTPVDTPIVFNLSATDLDTLPGNLAFSVVDAQNGLPVSSANLTVQVVGSQVTLTPQNGFSGTFRLQARVTDGDANASADHVDRQDFTLVVGDLPRVDLVLSSPTMNETGGTATLNAVLRDSMGNPTTSTQSVTVHVRYTGTAIFSTNNARNDYNRSGTTITIPAGSTMAVTEITLSALSDTLDEPDETIVMNIDHVVNAVENGTQSATLTILDDDTAPTVSLSASTTTIVEASGTVTLTVSLSAPSGRDITALLNLGGTATFGADYIASSTSFFIPAGATTATVVLTAVSDSIDEVNETIIANLASATNATVVPGSVTVTIQDDDTAPTATLAFTPDSFSENGGASILTATLSQTSSLPITVTLNFTGSATLGVDYTVSATTINIPAGSLVGSVTLNGLNDNLSEGNETVIATITGGSNVNFTNTPVTATIVDDEALPGVTLTVTPASISEAGGTATITANADRLSVNPIVINLSFTGTATFGVDYVVSTTITIPAGTNVATITLTAVDDALAEADETIIIGFASVQNAQVNSGESHTITLISDEVAPLNLTLDTGSDTGPSANDNFTSDGTPTFQANAAPGQVLELLVDGVVAGTMTDSGNTGTYRGALQAGMMQVGANQISVRVQGTTAASSPVTITYTPDYSESYTTPGAIGAAQNVSFGLQARQASLRNELGVYVADDASGRVNGILPGDPGYAQAVLNSTLRRTIFSRSDDAGANQVITLTGGQVLGFYLIQGGTAQSLLNFNPTNNLPRFASVALPVAFFSFDAANPDGIRHVQVVADPMTGIVEYRWEDLFGGGDLDYNDAVVQVNPNANGMQPTLETLRIPAASTAVVATTFQIEAGQQSPGVASSARTTPITRLTGEFGVIPVADAQGTVVNGSGSFAPGSAGWLAAALGARTTLFAAGAAVGTAQTVNLNGSQHYLFYTITNGSAADLLASNPTNSPASSAVALFSVDAVNPGGVEHFRWYGPEQVQQPTDGALRLHVMDTPLGGEEAFDRFTVRINY